MGPAGGRASGDRLGERGWLPAVLRGAGLESVSVRAVRGRPAAGDDAPLAGGVLRGAGWGAGGGADRSDGLLEGRDGRERGGAASRVRAVRGPVRVPAGLLRGGRPGVERGR